MASTRYTVEWLSEEEAERLSIERGGPRTGSDAEDRSIWDDVSEDEITKSFRPATKETAFLFAQNNAKLDMFGMPRIREETFQERFDDLGNPEGKGWEQTGYWEFDGNDVVEIGEAA